MIKATEQQIQKSIVQYLSISDDVVWAARINSGFMQSGHKGKKYYIHMAPKGTADILGMLKGGRFLALEVKRPGKRPGREQTEFLEAVRRGGGLAGVVTSVDDVIALLAEP